MRKDLAADGLRGVAAMNVVLCHFLIALYPLGFINLYPGAADQRAAPSWVDAFLSTPLLSIFWNGNFAVCVFFVLSGYVLTKPFVEHGDLLSMKLRAARRYFRLCVPILGSVLLSYTLLRLGLKQSGQLAPITHSAWLTQFWNFDPSIGDALRQGVYGAIFTGQSTYTPILWTMKIEFIGSMLVFGFRALNVGERDGCINLLIFGCALIAFFPDEWMLYLGFMAGSYLGAIQDKQPTILVAGAICMAIIFGGFDFSKWFAFSRALSLPPAAMKHFMNTIGAIALLYAVKAGCFDIALKSRPAQFLGRISYAVYLVHFPILLSLTSWLFIVLYTHAHIGYGEAAVIDLALTITTVLIVSSAFQASFDRFGIWLSQFIIRSPTTTLSGDYIPTGNAGAVGSVPVAASDPRLSSADR